MGFHLSTCPYCSFGCGLLLDVENGRLRGSHPSRSHPVGKGSLCIRGWNCVEAPYDRTRLTTARVRRDRDLTPVPADAAIQEIANRLHAIHTIAGRGPRRLSPRPRGARPVLFVVGPVVANEDVVAARRLAQFLGADICGAEIAGVRVARNAFQTVLGKGYSARSLDVIADADLIWLFGVDADNYPQVASRLVHARRRGATLVYFDVAAASSRPGLTAVLIPPGRSAVVPVLLQKAAFDLDAVPPRVKNIPQFSSLAKPFVPGRGPLLPEHDWFPDELAHDLTRTFLAARRTAVVVGDRWLGSTGGEEQTIQLVQALVLLGAEDRVVMATGEANSWGCADFLTGSSDGTSSLVDLLDVDQRSSPRALFIVGDDLMRRTPRSDVLARRLSDIETVVVIDRFETACVPFADVVLPSAAFAELDGSVTNALGMVQRWRKVIEPPGNARPEREWFEALGGRLGMIEWPADDQERLRAAASLNAAYSPDALAAVYDDEKATTTVWLEEQGRINFVEPSLPPAARRPDGFPLHLHFRAHPAFWSTGVLSEREQLLKREATDSVVRLSAGDLQRAGLRDGSAAKVVTPYGEAILTARGDPSLPDGVSVITVFPQACKPSMGTAAVAADGGELVSGCGVGETLRGFYPDAERRAIGTEPVPGRIERA